MKLIDITVAGFRGFNEELSIDLSGKLVIYYGPNGSGKTSIGESIEWLFYGKTIKRVKGDEISKREYEGSYRNTHYSRPENPFVEARIIDNAGSQRTIRRELKADETSILSVDGKPVDNLKEFGIGNLYDRPLILQHTLQDFIFMRPKERYDVLSAMLGLDPLIDFRSAVETAKNDFTKNLPSNATSAQNRASLLIASLDATPLLQPVARAIAQRKLDDARKHLVDVALGRVPGGTKEADLLSALSQAKASKERARLDWGRFSLNPVASPDSHPAISELANLQKHVGEFENHLAEAEKKVAESPREIIPSQLRQFYEIGLSLIKNDNAAECPLCLQETLTAERVARIRQAVVVTPQAKPPLSAAQASMTLLQRALNAQWQEAKKMIPLTPNESERKTIAELVPGGADQYFSSCSVIEQLAGEIEEKKRVLDRSITSVHNALQEGNAPKTETLDLNSALQGYAGDIKKLPGVANGYAANYASIDALVKSTLASESDVQFLSLLVRGIEQWKDIKVSNEINSIQEEIQELIRQTRSYIGSKQKQILGLRDQEIKSWYQRLSGGVAVGYSGINPGTDNLELRAKTFAKVMMAAPNLSASQLNCIGLAVYLATCTRNGSPFRFVLFDDPIQSMDDEHTEAFKKEVISKLISDEFQVILLTHMDQFANRVESLYRSHNPAIYRMEEYTQAGPIIDWKGPEVQKLLNDVKRNKDATSEGYRKQAVQALRQFVEEFVKDIFTRDTGKTISKRYENKSWGELRNLLRQCARFDAADEPALEDTHNWTSPFLHTDDTLAHTVPPSGHINPHYEAMKALLEKYRDILAIT
jgi:hypothetical protein